MAETRTVLVACGLPLAGALVGFWVGKVIGEEVVSAHIEAAPKNVGHGPAYVAGALYLLALFASTFVGAVVGGFAAIWYCRRGTPRPDRGDGSTARP